jgi:hypothetical protein
MQITLSTFSRIFTIAFVSTIQHVGLPRDSLYVECQSIGAHRMTVLREDTVRHALEIVVLPRAVVAVALADERQDVGHSLLLG